MSTHLRSVFARIRAGATLAMSVLGALCRPVLYLWPWLLGAVLFGVFVRSAQGIALAQRYREDVIALRAVIAVLVASWLAVGFACLLALMVPVIRRTERLATEPTVQATYALDTIAGGAWVVALASVFGVLFAASIGLAVPWIVVSVLALAGMLGIVWTMRSVHHDRSVIQRLYRAAQRHPVLVITTASLFALVPLGLGASISIENPVSLAKVGPLLAGMVGMSSIATLLGIVLIIMPLALRRAWLGAVFVMAMAAWTTGHRAPVDLDNPLLRDYHKNDLRSEAYKYALPGRCAENSSALLESTLRRHAENSGPSMSFDRSFGRARHLYLVSAEGGGIRAAYWTALTLAELDIATRGTFGEEVASLSGVSGGSLGIATWLAARDREDLNAPERLQLITEFLGSDFLSPALGGFLFLDVPRLIMGPLWFKARRDQVFEKALADRWLEVAKSDFFARQYGYCVGGFRLAPAVFLNATDALTGGYIPLSTTLLPSEPPAWNEAPDPKGPRRISWHDPQLVQNTSLAKASWAQMVSISARFPYIAPEAHVGIDATVLANDRAQAERERAAIELPEQLGDARFKGLYEALSKANSTRLANLEAETQWSRVWVLVDGGYFDNSALTPTLHAIRIIDAERKKERESGSGPETAQLFTATSVHVVHISNDPGDPCLPLPGAWQEQLSARARKFLATTKQSVDCLGDLSRLEDSMRQSALYSFLTPMEALLSVRTEHSRKAVFDLNEMMRGRPIGDTLEMRDLATAFADAYGIRPKRQGHSEEEIRKNALAWMQRADETFAWATAEAARRVGGLSTQKAVDAYLKALAEWHDLVNREGREVDCHKPLSKVGPPLGWTLSKENQRLMLCLSLRDRTAGILGRELEPPYMPGLDEYTTSEAQFRWRQQ